MDFITSLIKEDKAQSAFEAGVASGSYLDISGAKRIERLPKGVQGTRNRGRAKRNF